MNMFDLNLQYTLSDVLISITLFVLSFMALFYFGYFRDSKEREQESYKFKDMLIEGYFHKFDEYNQIISDLRTKLDMIQMKVNSVNDNIIQNEIVDTSDMDSEKSQDISHSTIPVTNVTNDVTINQRKDDEKDELRLSTVDSILKMLEVPLTSREIQRRVNKSREHTSRLLKKLYSENIVMRDGSSRPFKYKITNEGRKLLERTANSSR
jgi:predicted transcriptional regulator